METETGEAKIPLLSTVPVSVTDNGFDPDVVTITVGATVEWTNRTQETVHLQSGEPYRIYLPLVLRNVGGAGGQAASAPEPASQAEVRLTASATFSGTLLPGGTLTHTFTSEGDYPYFLTNNPTWTGLVNVKPIPFDFEMGVTPPSRSVAQGQSVTYTVRVTGTLGDPQPVTLTVGGLPAVAAWGLNPSTVVPTSTAVLSITTALTTPVGNHMLVITGTGGGQVHTATATLAVATRPDFEVAVTPAMRSAAQGQSVTYTVSLTALHGFDKPVSFSTDALPAGTAAIWGQNPLTPTDTTVLTITTSLTTPLGSHLLAVTGAGGGFSHQVPITLEVTPHPDFGLGVTPDTRSVRQSRAVTATVMLTALHGFAAPVALSVGGLPGGVTTGWATNPLTPDGMTVLTFTTALTIPLGSHSLVITGTGGGFIHTTPFTLTVLPHPDFAFAIAPATRTITQGLAVTFTTHLTAENEWEGPVQLSVQGLPTGTVASWVSNPVTPSGSSLLTLTTTLTTPVGNHTLIITGTGGGQVHTATATLVATPHPDFEVAIAPAVRSAAQGQSVTYTVSLTGWHGFDKPVLLSTDGLPAGTAAIWSQNPLTPTDTTVLMITTSLTTPLGAHLLTLIGSGGGRVHGAPFTLTVTPHPDFGLGVMPDTRSVRQSRAVTATVTLTALHGFAAPVALSVGGLPGGVTTGWATNPLLPDGSTVLTLTTALTTPLGSHSLIITGTGGGFIHTTPFTLTVLPHPDFAFAVIPPTRTITQGLAVTFTTHLTAENEWEGPVQLSIQGLPTGTVASWVPNPITPSGSSLLSITTALTTPVGNHTLVITGTGGGQVHTATATLVVTPHPDFEVAVAPAARSAAQGESVTYTVSLTGLHGFDKPVSLSTDGLPAGTAAIWGQNPLTPTDTTVLTITTSLTTPLGSHLLAVTGAGGGFSHQVPITLEVTPHPDFAIDVQPPTQAVTQAQGVTYTVYLTSEHGFADAVTLTVGGLPDGAAAEWGANPVVPSVSGILTVTTASNTPTGDYTLVVTGTGGGFTHTAGITLTVLPRPKPDLVVSAIGTIPMTPTTWISTTLVVTVTNAGSGDALWPFAVDAYLNLSQPPTLGQTGDFSWVADSLASEATTVLTAAHIFTETGDVVLYAQVDTGNVISETNEANNVTGPLTVTVNFNVVEVCGSITEDTMWVAGNVYVVTCDVAVNSGVTLTLEPGVIVKFESTAYGLNVNGTLRSQGMAGNPIYFTSYKDDSVGGDTNGDGAASTPTAGDWDCVYVAGGRSATFEHTILRYGGNSSGYDAIIRGYTDATVTLSHSEVRYSGYYGIGIAAGNYVTATLKVENSVISDNARQGIYMDAGPYGNNDLTVVNSTISHNGDDGIWATDVSALVVTGTTFSTNNGYAMELHRIGVEYSQVYSNTAANNKYNAIAFTDHSYVAGSSVLRAEIPYVIEHLAVVAGATLRVEPGVVMKSYIMGSSLANISVSGLLQSQGTAEDPIYFTSFKDDDMGGDTNGDGGASNPAAGDWGSIFIENGGEAIFEYTRLRYGGNPLTYRNGVIFANFNDATVMLSHSEVRYSGYYGIGIAAGNYVTATLRVENSVISDNARQGIYMDAGPYGNNDLTVVNSTISHNGDDGIWATDVSALVVTGTTFSTNNGYAMELHRIGVEYSQVYSNTAANNKYNAIAFTDHSYVAGSSVLRAEIPYVIEHLAVVAGATLRVEPGVVMKSYIMGSSLANISVSGLLQSQGTAEDPIYFTSFKDDDMGGDTNGDGGASNPAAGDWGSIFIENGGEAIFEYTRLRYGGNPLTYRNGVIFANFNDATVMLSHSEVRYSGYYGIGIAAGNYVTATLRVENSVISDNARQGIYMDAGPYGNNDLTVINSTISQNGSDGIWIDRPLNTTIRNSNISGNGGYGVCNGSGSTSYLVDAHHNWWGSDSGPAPYGSGNGINYTTSCSNGVCTIIPYVDVIPWIGQQAYYGQNVPNVAYEADPVNTANGNYAYQRTDLNIPTRGLPLEFARAYNSLSPESGPLGYGWRHTWRVTAEENGDDVYITYGDGRQIRFTWDGSAYVPAAGVFSTLTKSGGVFHLTEKNQTVYHFDTQGRLASVEDKNGNTTTLTYTGDDLTTITGPASRTLTFAYTSPISDSLISSVADSLARSIHFTYNITGELTVVTDTRGFTTTYTYDAGHRLLNITDANDHTFLTNEYNDAGRVSKQWDAEGNQWAFAYDEPDHDTIVTDPLGRATTYDYDAQLRLVNEIDALDNTASYDYDTNNNPVQIIDKRSYTTTYAYDDRGNVTIITDTLDYTRTFTYDAQNNPTGETDPLGHTSVYTYDASSNLIARADPQGNVTTWAYDTYGQVISQTNALPRTTRYAYDTYGHQTAITDALTNTTTFTYDLVGRKLSETDPESHTTNYAYDAVNHITVITDALSNPITYGYDAVGNRTVITDANGHPTTYTYDEKDRLVSVTDPLSHTTTYGYDEVSNQTAVTDALSYATTYAYDALNRRIAITDTLGNTTHYQYDANGNRTHLTDANGNATQYAYDALNRLVSVTDAEDGTVTYTYDANGNRTSMTDANDHATAYTYDSLNRLISITDPLTYTTIYTYDAVGNRVGEQKPDGTVITYTYDTLDHLVDVSAPGLSVEYAYDTVGSRTMMTDSTGVTTYTYDVLYRLTQVAATTGTLQYTYDLNGNRTHLTYPDGEVVTYTYDLANRPTTVTDWAGRVITYTYDDAGRQTEVAYPNNVQASYTYDDAGRLLVITHTSSVSGTFAFFRYSLDAVGNRLVMTDTDGVTAYAYDDLYRLLQVNYPDSEQVAYAYDPLGNRTALTSTVSGVVTYTYNAGDRLLTTGSDTFGWDANGRMITRTYGINTASYTFDPLDRLTQVISGATTVQFTYNGDGVRVGKSVGGANTGYIQDVSSSLPVVLAETAGGQTSYYVYGNDLETWVDPAGNPTFYHYDGLGSTRALSNLTGQRTDAYSYDVFGAVRSHTGGAAQSFTFTGEQVDDELGLVYLRARYYDPALGRFLTPDPRLADSWNPQDWNLYVYGRNNPVVYIDADGESPIVPIIGGIQEGYGIYRGAKELTCLWGIGQEYVNTTQRMIHAQDIDEILAAAEQRQHAWGRVSVQAIRTATSFPGTTFSGAKPGISMTGSEMIFGEVIKGFYDHALLSPVRYGMEEIIRRQHGVRSLESANPQTGQPYHYVPSHTPGGYLTGDHSGGSWGGPPSGGK